jgi:hypothetical protein
MEVFNLPLPSNDGIRPNMSQYFIIFVAIFVLIHLMLLKLQIYSKKLESVYMEERFMLYLIIALVQNLPEGLKEKH